jgi:alkylation response protein AidB-like acyl-CoA dehydrogenase
MSNADVTLRNASDVALAAYADELAAEIAKTASHYDQTGTFPHEHFALLRERGALKLTVPKAHGGRGLSLYETLIFQERLARGSGSTALSLGWHLMIFGYLSHELKWSPEAFRQLCHDVVHKGELINVLVTEREAGNLLRGARASTVARQSGDGYVITGQKAFCSSAPALNQMIVYAWVEEEQRTAEFLVPKSDKVRVIESWNTLGMRSTGSHDVAFDGVSVPRSALLSYIEVGKTSSFTVGSRAFGLQLSAVYLGIASAARDFALAFAAGYHSHSLGGVILDAPQVQHKLGEIELLLGASKTLLYGLAARWEQHQDIRHRLNNEVAITKVTVTRNAIRIVELALGIVGGHALSKDLPLERYFRDVQCALYNPPQDDTVLTQLAREATTRYRAGPAGQTPAGERARHAAPESRSALEPATEATPA